MNVKLKKWKFVGCGSELGLKLGIEDDSIFTVDDEEVVGCSEWMRVDDGVMQYIVDLHNKTLTA